MAVSEQSRQIFQQVVEGYSAPLLSWAFQKTGDSYEAEDLAQEVMLHIFSAVIREQEQGRPIGKLENFVWRIARYVWCRRLRDTAYGSRKQCLLWAEPPDLPDGSDFAAQLAEEDETGRLLANMRSHISRLNFLQREILISFYLEGKSLREISRSLGISEGAVKWHLFDTRKKLQKEMTAMENTPAPAFLYRPRRLHMGISGQAVPCLDTKALESSLSKQNICIACYASPQSPQELAGRLGIPQAYLEDDLRWLAEKEFVTVQNGRYATAFLIEDSDSEQAKYAVYAEHKSTLSDAVVGGLLQAEPLIRSIGFGGCDRPMDRMLWWLIYRFTSSLPLPLTEAEKPPYPLRPDGGQYFPLGFDRTDPPAGCSLDTAGWAYNGPMCNDGFHWFGLYHFGRSPLEDILDGYTEENRLLHNMLKEAARAPLPLTAYDENGRLLLSRLVEQGLLRLEEGLAHPAFPVFTAAQQRRLEKEVFAPIAAGLKGELERLVEDLRRLYQNRLPAHLRDMTGLAVQMAAGDIAYVTTILAFREGRLYAPADSHDGQGLTFLYIDM